MKISSIAIGFLSAALLYSPASAAETDYAGGAQALPLQRAVGSARGAAMGSAVVAVPDGSASLLWNPAGLSRMSCTEIGLHDNQGLGGLNQETAVVGTPLGMCTDDGKGGSLGGIAASLGYVNYGSFQGRDALTGLPNGNYSAADYSGSLGWGKELLPGLSGGADLRVIHSNLADHSYDAFAADLGLLYTVIPSLDLGLAYSNINLGDKIGGSQLASGWRLGAGWTVTKHWIVAVAGELQSHTLNRIQAGTEYLIGNLERKANVLALRAGYLANYPNAQLDGFTGLTWGLGYTLTQSLALDYAMVPAGDLGMSHRVSLTFKFNCPEKPQPRAVTTAATTTPPLVAAAPAPIQTLSGLERASSAAPIVAAAAPPPIVLKSILLEDSHFDFDKSALRPEGMAALRENVQILKDNPKTLVRVAGYTSMMGTADYNQKLSERRAAAVENYLITEGGIAPSRIATIGYGATNPATYEATPGISDTAAAKSNMRVLFEITVKP